MPTVMLSTVRCLRRYYFESINSLNNYLNKLTMTNIVTTTPCLNKFNYAYFF